MEKSIQKLLDKLGKKGFDTEKKVNSIDMQVAFENGFTTDEVGGSTYAFIMGGSDTKPEKKEAKRNADDGRTEGAGIRTETYENEGY